MISLGMDFETGRVREGVEYTGGKEAFSGMNFQVVGVYDNGCLLMGRYGMPDVWVSSKADPRFDTASNFIRNI